MGTIRNGSTLIDVLDTLSDNGASAKFLSYLLQNRNKGSTFAPVNRFNTHSCDTIIYESFNRSLASYRDLPNDRHRDCTLVDARLPASHRSAGDNCSGAGNLPLARGAEHEHIRMLYDAGHDIDAAAARC